MRIALFCIILALLCQACNQQPRKTEARAGNPESQAQQMIVTGNYLGAAEEYIRLAELYPGQAVFYQLRTADSLIRAGDTAQASDILNHIEATKYNDSLYRNILMARIALSANQGQTALTLLSAPLATGTLVELISFWHRTKSQAYELTLNFINAAEERIQLDSYLLDPLERRTNINLLWEDLNRIKVPVLRELRNSGSETMTAWIELTIINQTMLFKPDLLEQALASWTEQYPDHAATPTITHQILALSEKAVLQPEHIAILLPLHGQYE